MLSKVDTIIVDVLGKFRLLLFCSEFREEMHPNENDSPPPDFGLSLSVMVEGSAVVPLGEYLLNVGKLLETLLTHNASPEQAEAFIRSGAASKLLSLLYVRQIPVELSQSIFPQLVTNILRFLFVSGSFQSSNFILAKGGVFCLHLFLGNHFFLTAAPHCKHNI